VGTVVWLPGAREDVARLHAFLKEKSARAARAAIAAIREGARTLEAFPQAGRPMDDDTGRRELFVPFGARPYVLRYRLDGDRVVILRVWHARELR
jgi:plasmid stabilization system protein ParE